MNKILILLASSFTMTALHASTLSNEETTRCKYAQLNQKLFIKIGPTHENWKIKEIQDEHRLQLQDFTCLKICPPILQWTFQAKETGTARVIFVNDKRKEIAYLIHIKK